MERRQALSELAQMEAGCVALTGLFLLCAEAMLGAEDQRLGVWMPVKVASVLSSFLQGYPQDHLPLSKSTHTAGVSTMTNIVVHTWMIGRLSKSA